MIAGEGLDPVLVVGRSPAQDPFAEHRNANDVSEKVHHLFGPRQPTEVAVNDNAVEAMVNEQQQVADTIWPAHRTVTSKAAKGYRRQQFEEAWRRYCADDGTASQPSNIMSLRAK